MLSCRENWEALVKRFGLNDRYLGQLIPSITAGFGSTTKLEEASKNTHLTFRTVFCLKIKRKTFKFCEIISFSSYFCISCEKSQLFILLQMKTFFEKYPDAGAGASYRVTALETVSNNIKWLSKYKDDVEEVVKNYSSS